MDFKKTIGGLAIGLMIMTSNTTTYANLPTNSPDDKQRIEESNYDYDLIFGDEYRVYNEFSDLYSIPVSGEITSPFGWRESPIDGNSKFHYGIDIANKAGTPICSIKRGVVVRVVQDDPIYGINVKVQHEDGSLSYYAHLMESSVNTGDKVEKGMEVGKLGTTGASTGPHLHFEIVINGENVDPTEFIFQSSNRKGIAITEKNLVKNKPKPPKTNSSNTNNSNN